MCFKPSKKECLCRHSAVKFRNKPIIIHIIQALRLKNVGNDFTFDGIFTASSPFSDIKQILFIVTY